MVGYIFGKGQTYASPEELKKARSVANALVMQQSAPKDVGSGLNAIGQALLYRSMMGKADASEKAGKESASAAFNPILAALGGPTAFPAAPGSSKVADALAGKKPDNPNLPSRLDFARSDANASDLPASFLASMDKVEGAGDYDTLFGHAQRDGGAFAGTHVSGMSINDALAFADPSGPYGQSVKGKIGRVATPMGRHQIVGTTLRNAVSEIGLDPNTPFNRQTQDTIAAHLARRRIASADTMGGKMAALRSEWEGFKNVPDAQLQQIVTDLEAGSSRTALAANNAMATGQPIPPAPVQVASLDPSVGMNAAMSPVPPEYAATGLSPQQWQAMNAPDGGIPQPSAPQPGVTPGAPGAETPPGQRVLAQMMNPQPMGGSPMPMQGMPQQAAPQPQQMPQAPQQVAQAQQPGPDLSTLSPAAGGTAGTFDAAQGPSLQMLYNALQQPWLSDEQRAIVTGEIQRQQKANDPATQLDMEYRRAQIAKLQSEGSGPAELGLNPQYGVDPQGNPVLIQIGKDGKAVQTAMPEGVQLSKEPIKLDAGTHFVLLDPITRLPVGNIPKENYQESFDKGAGGAAGKAQAEAAANLPTDLQTADQAVSEIDALINHPGLPSIAGSFDQYRPSWTMGAEGKDALARFNQAKGRAFLQAFGMLKGGGQITEIEGLKAEQAMARMDRAQGETEFKQALEDFRDAVKAGAQKMRERAGTMPMPASQNPGPTVPAPAAEPSVDDLLKKYGG